MVVICDRGTSRDWCVSMAEWPMHGILCTSVALSVLKDTVSQQPPLLPPLQGSVDAHIDPARLLRETHQTQLHPTDTFDLPLNYFVAIGCVGIEITQHGSDGQCRSRVHGFRDSVAVFHP